MNFYKVYSGKAYKCMCGCAGKYSYTLQGAKEHNPGYSVDDAISERSVKIIVNRILRDPNHKRDSDHVYLDKNDRILVAWFDPQTV